MPENKQIKVAVIGTGGWGYQHARVFKDREDVHLCAIVGRNSEKTKVRAELFATKAYTNIEKMLEMEQPDLVSICLPNQQHFAPTLQVIQAGFPLLVEKPIAFELEEAEILLNEADKRNLFFAINFNHRYAKPVQLAYDAMKNGEIGDVSFVSWRFGGEGSSNHPYANLIETQCHGFDMLEHLCGPIKSVMAEMADITGGGFQTMSLSLRFESGAVGNLIGTYESSYAYPETHRVEINGIKGRSVIYDTVKKYSFHSTGSEFGEVWEAGYFNDPNREFHKTFDRHIDALLEALKSGKPAPVHAEAGYRALKIAYAAIKSFHSGMRIEISE
ncbi:oxidoreductase [Bacillus sp. J14TS2]|uniref:Gfo/Idh/MocA family protein n=1 Tax=Bacillus sp. J14TS2 TaxID=2807188 RepID=UPI001B03CDA0|nr:Gfo/Idh/MocA family oxidoreductase [Bacillus sp. J14TS2]GIN74561.1 oxidoreductase [Bacillus sp. J14TS2]